MFAVQVQQLEDLFQAMLSLASIDDASGAQLQVIGRIVGELYTGEPDAIYRLRVRARIRANASSGDPDDLYAVFLACFGLAGTGQAEIIPGGTAQFVFRVLALPLDGPTAAVLFDLLSGAKVAGSRLVLEWPTVVSATGFCCGDADDPTADFGPGCGDTDDLTVGGALAGALSI